MKLFNHNCELRNVTLLDGMLEVEESRPQSVPLQCDLIPAILAVNNNLVLDMRSALSILVSTIRTSNFQFEVHMFSKTIYFELLEPCSFWGGLT